MKEKTYKSLTQVKKNLQPHAIGNRLTREQQLRVIQWCVELKSNQEIKDLIKQNFDKDIARMSVWRYRSCPKWRPLIKRLRERFEKEIAKIPIANKVDRVRYLQRVVKEGLKWSLKTINAQGDHIYELKLGAVTQALKEVRVEMEGDKPLVNIERHTHYTNIDKEAFNKLTSSMIC